MNIQEYKEENDELRKHVADLEKTNNELNNAPPCHNSRRHSYPQNHGGNTKQKCIIK